eukprot:TRINITY_DN5012_c0_g1_i2.p1 TRINITY_DN5012_c0_g1~~TRINITY_DN5012_c0_g1_i2.p1  ORF type:complete len:236 (+),score=17.60 TRINITY_DN5012_c0_g1_i2:99-806(+)
MPSLVGSEMCIRDSSYREYEYRMNLQQIQKSQLQQVPQSQTGCKSLMQGVNTQQFLILLVLALFSSTPGFFIMSQYKVIGLISNLTDKTLTLFGTISFIFFGLSREIWNKINRKIGFRNTFFILLIILMIASTIFVICSNSTIAFGTSGFLIVVIQGGLFQWFSNFIPKVFGQKYSTHIFGFILISFAMSNLFLHIAVTFVIEEMTWNILLWFQIIELALSFLLFYKFDENPVFI